MKKLQEKCMKILFALIILCLSGCASYHREAYKYGKPGLSFVSQNGNCTDRITIGAKVKFTKCF